MLVAASDALNVAVHDQAVALTTHVWKTPPDWRLQAGNHFRGLQNPSPALKASVRVESSLTCGRCGALG